MTVTFDLASFVIGFGSGAAVTLAVSITVNSIRNVSSSKVQQKNLRAKNIAGRDVNNNE